jgi:hypothetical protein
LIKISFIKIKKKLLNILDNSVQRPFNELLKALLLGDKDKFLIIPEIIYNKNTIPIKGVEVR